MSSWFTWLCFLPIPTFPYLSDSGVVPPKRSRGKPALSRVPFLEGVNGDSDYSSSGENGHPAAPLWGGPCSGPTAPQGWHPSEPGRDGPSVRWEPVPHELSRLCDQAADLPVHYHLLCCDFRLLHKKFFPAFTDCLCPVFSSDG